MSSLLLKFLRIFIVAFVIAFSTACSSVVTLDIQPPSIPYDPSLGSAFKSAPKYTAVLLSTQATFNELPSNVNEGFKDRVIQQVRDTGAFKAVYKDDQLLSASSKVKMSLITNEVFEYNQALNGLKGFVIGASFFTLSPIIPIYASFTSEVRLRIEKPDGSSRDYIAKVKGDSEHSIFRHEDYFRELSSKVVEAALKSLGSDISNDRRWLQK